MAMNKIERPISPEAVTGFKRVGRNAAFLISENLEMVQQIRVVTLDENAVPILDRISTDPKLNAAQKEKAMARYQDQIVTKQTEGAFVDPRTGAVVPEGTAGSIAQSQFMQLITPKMLRAMGKENDDDTPILEMVYWMLAQEIENVDKRGDL